MENRWGVVISTGWHYDGGSRGFLRYLRAIYSKSGLALGMASALSFAAAGYWSLGLAHGVELCAIVVAVILLLGFRVWRRDTREGVANP
jgi:hypothetical protein